MKRAFPVTGSRPIVPIMIPVTALMRDFRRDPPVTLLRAIEPKTMSEKNSGGPKERAASASYGAKNTSPNTPIVPAMKDPMAEIARAGPALPFCAILYPSMQVITEAVSPGTLRRIEVVEPPYIAP